MRLHFNILTTKGYEEVYGYKIYKNFSCYRKDKGNWLVIDIDTGCYLKDKLHSYQECFQWIHEEDNLNSFLSKTNKKQYKKAKEELDIDPTWLMDMLSKYFIHSTLLQA